jgi:hypothetical protein
MNFPGSEAEIDSICHKGESLKKAATDSPEKWYIPLEQYERMTEKVREAGYTIRDLRNDVWVWRSATLALLAIIVALLCLHWR